VLYLRGTQTLFGLVLGQSDQKKNSTCLPVRGGGKVKLSLADIIRKVTQVLSFHDELLNGSLISSQPRTTREKYAHLDLRMDGFDTLRACLDVAGKHTIFDPAELLHFGLQDAAFDQDAFLLALV
jgi:hypothetical protein